MQGTQHRPFRSLALSISMKKPSGNIVSISILTLVPIFAWVAEHVLTLLLDTLTPRGFLVALPMEVGSRYRRAGARFALHRAFKPSI